MGISGRVRSEATYTTRVSFAYIGRVENRGIADVSQCGCG